MTVAHSGRLAQQRVPSHVLALGVLIHSSWLNISEVAAAWIHDFHINVAMKLQPGSPGTAKSSSSSLQAFILLEGAQDTINLCKHLIHTPLPIDLHVAQPFRPTLVL